MNIKLTPAEWEMILGITIIDPDGWNRKNLDADWAKPLTFDEFYDKATESTVDRPMGDKEEARIMARLNIVSYV